MPDWSFIGEHYEAACRWARVITRNDLDQANDLVHDTFLRLSQQAPVDIRDPNAYVFTALQNTYRTQLRNSNRLVVGTDELVRHDLFLAATIDDGIIAREDLMAVCRYLVARKARSISASIMLLRYFHGYYVQEVARIVKRTRNAVEVRIASGRKEIEESAASGQCGPKGERRRQLPDAEEFLAFQSLIFARGRSFCPLVPTLVLNYSVAGALPRSTLSHIVSCRRCLEQVNRVLGLDSLEMRHPLDSIREQIEVQRSAGPKVETVKLKAVAAAG